MSLNGRLQRRSKVTGLDSFVRKSANDKQFALARSLTKLCVGAVPGSVKAK
jgi:hypothetical protein